MRRGTWVFLMALWPQNLFEGTTRKGSRLSEEAAPSASRPTAATRSIFINLLGERSSRLDKHILPLWTSYKGWVGSRECTKGLAEGTTTQSKLVAGRSWNIPPLPLLPAQDPPVSLAPLPLPPLWHASPFCSPSGAQYLGLGLHVLDDTHILALPPSRDSLITLVEYRMWQNLFSWLETISWFLRIHCV